MSTKIYTKTGDKGKTSLIGGKKVPKNDTRIETYGTVDELNSWIGMVKDQLNFIEIKSELKYIQDCLFTIGSLLASDSETEIKMELPKLHDEDVHFLEERIDSMTAQLTPLKSFILPGGHVIVSSIHISRCVCRRAERLVVSLQEMKIVTHELIIKFMNRLSDYLFTLARYASLLLHADEIAWTPGKD